MDKISELKQLLESLKQEKLDNEKIIGEINYEYMKVILIGNYLIELNTAKCKFESESKDLKMIKKFCLISSISGVGSFIIGSLFHVVSIITSVTDIWFWIWILSTSILITIASVTGIALKNYNPKYKSLEEIQKEIEEKEKQHELMLSKYEVNKKILIEKEQRQIELDEEIKKCAIELSKYEAVKDDIVNKFLNSPEFSQIMNNQMSEIDKMTKEEKGSSYQKRNNH